MHLQNRLPCWTFHCGGCFNVEGERAPAGLPAPVAVAGQAVVGVEGVCVEDALGRRENDVGEAVGECLGGDFEVLKRPAIYYESSNYRSINVEQLQDSSEIAGRSPPRSGGPHRPSCCRAPRHPR